MSSPTIVTSLSPHPEAQDRQAEAIRTWKASGYQSISLNFSNEIPSLKKRHPNHIQILRAHRKSPSGKGRQLVPIVDLIEASFAHGNGRQAFVLNSDILLTGNLMQFTSEPFSGVLLLPRWGIDRFPEPSKQELNPWGWDGIILGPDLRKKYNNPRFAMGLPWWDYWIPFRATHLGAEVKILKGKLALHVDHPEKWDEKDRAALAGEMWREVGIGPLRRLWLRHLGPKRERKIYGYHNHLAGHVREIIKKPI